MRAYGKDRGSVANRRLRGTNMKCPCCIPFGASRKNSTKVFKKKERQIARRQAKEE